MVGDHVYDRRVGPGVGVLVGAENGLAVGKRVGLVVGDMDGPAVGVVEGVSVGLDRVGNPVGLCVGALVGDSVVGAADGSDVVGGRVGAAVGWLAHKPHSLSGMSYETHVHRAVGQLSLPSKMWHGITAVRFQHEFPTQRHVVWWSAQSVCCNVLHGSGAPRSTQIDMAMLYSQLRSTTH